MITDRDFTVFTKGVDIETDAVDPLAGTVQSPLRYHGTFAQEGPIPGAKVLTDIDGLGNARWMPLGTIPQTSGCPITSAWTSDCTLYLINCTGGTLTANTCTTFGNISPYEYGAGTDSIKPILSSLQTTGDRASIGGGLDNHINLTMNGRIGGGYDNLLSGGTSTGILAGTSNTITLSNSAAIGAGSNNTIGTDTLSAPFSFIGAGLQNDIVGTYGKNFIGSGEGNIIGKSSFATGNGWSNIVGGAYNKIYGHFLVYNSIVGGYDNEITGSSYSFIGGGYDNKIYTTSNQGVIGGGYLNKIDDSLYSFIGGGLVNKIINGGDDSSIVGGSGNTIGPLTSALYSNIQGGEHNTIGGDGPVTHASIVNGKDNLVQHDYSVIMGSRGITSNRPHTTFLTGLDANTVDADGAAQLFRYHGAPASPGLNRVLVDSTGFGDAVWAENITPGGGGWTGDCAVVSAYTDGCTLYMLTNCTGGTGSSWILVNGNITYTANTCNTFNEGPYKYGHGFNSITTKLPIGILGNYVATNSPYSNIGGGVMNTISATTVANIAGGYFNKIKDGWADGIGSGLGNKIDLGGMQAGAGYAYIGGGQQNEITGTSTSRSHFIGGGSFNRLHNGIASYNSIVGGYENKIFETSDSSSIVGGRHNTIQLGSEYSAILGGEKHLIKFSDWSSILAGSGNTIYSDAGVKHAAIVNGKENWVQHDSSAIIGADGRTSEKTHVTYTNGVDIDSDLGNGGTRYLKYHGSLANPTVAGHVLTDVDGFGNAVWAPAPGGDISWTGDCAVISAYTSGCTLYMLTNCIGATGTAYILVNGNITYTANTCNTFGGVSPYMYKGGSGSISTVIPAQGTTNENLTSFWYFLFINRGWTKE